MYQLGSITADTRASLADKAVDLAGLKLADDENIGKRVRFKNPSCDIENKTFIITGRQMAYGYDINGVYDLIKAYRGIPEGEDSFGRPIHLYEVEFID